MNDEESVWYISAAKGTRLHIPVLLALTTGMRRSEILAVLGLYDGRSLNKPGEEA